MSSISPSDAMDFIASQPPNNSEVDKYITTSDQQPSPLPSVKTVLPLVYIQPASKLPLNKTNNTNNVLVNTVPHQLQFTAIAPKNVTKNQGVILTPVKNLTGNKTQQLVIQKPGMHQVVTNSKIGTLLTMIKPNSQSGSGCVGGGGGVGGVSGVGGEIINSNNLVQTNTTPHQGQKFVIAPMPKVIKNRLPVTVTTNTLQSKIAIMPFIPPSSNNNNNNDNNKLFNIKLDNQIISEEQQHNGDDNYNNGGGGDDDDTKKCKKNMICDETLEKSPTKSEKEYELSIIEDSNSTKIESMVTINIPSDTALTPIIKQQTPPTLNNTNKDCLKFAKHGVSILKKNYVQNDLTKIRKTTNPTSLLDSNKEIEVIPDPDKGKMQRPERRRKSNFSYRKDYDEIEVESVDLNNKKMNNNNEENGNCLEKKLIKENNKSDINMNDDFDLKKILKWDEGIGTLPGSDLKFILNEFNIIEFITKEDYIKIIEKKRKETTTKINDFQEEMRCLECGCYGLPSEFISPKYCSYDCQENGKNKQIKEKEINKNKKKRRKGTTNNNNNNINSNNNNNNNNSHNNNSTKDICNINNNDNDDNDDDDTSNDNSQDRYACPWACSKKGFSWTKYLEHIKAKAAPEKLFKDPFPYNRNCFKIGMKLEGIDPQHPSYFCVLTVNEICGYRIRLHFDGYPDNYDFWVNADSRNIFPVGWCEKHGHILQPPPGYTIDHFNWMNYLKQTKSTAAPKHLFSNRVGNSICPNGFRVGMKLEAVDKKNKKLVCVATVKDMMDNRILVHFDSWDDIYDYWADPTSPYIHPVGWCDQFGHRLTPPNGNLNTIGQSINKHIVKELGVVDYPNPEQFSWSKYLKETKSVAAPVRAFKQRAINGFKRGMRLECVDKRVPQLIRVATVDDTKNHQIRIKFDGWMDRYSYWVDDDDENIHPVGWCQKTGHPIEMPLTPADVYDFLECPTVGCRGIGHTQGPKYQTHSEQKYCPYAEDNVDIDRILPDRLLVPNRLTEAVIPISIEPKEKIKPRIGRPPKCAKIETNEITTIKLEIEEEDPSPKDIKPPKRKSRKEIKIEPDCEEEEDDEEEKSKIQSAMELIENSKSEPAEKESWEKHSKFLKNYIQDDTNPMKWDEDAVQDFVNSIPGCENDGYEFKYREIDGEAFLSLNQRDLIDLLSLKVGPAVKLYNAIVLLRKNVSHKLFS